MAYTALYRKWRPTRFEDVRGQDHIVRTLKNQINSGRIGHAYLFCGTRGTGKTTIAKIMARAVNCENPKDGSPCNECPTCRAILSGTSINVAEIDAASNNGVDNIREIREQVQYSPTSGKYRVFIIDEVHMLSQGAFNALLKTLEEPPSYVIFILATTESSAIPVTVLSRCQRYDFRRIGSDVIAAQLRDLLAKEGVEADDDAIRYVAKAADGAMRDALSLMEQCISFYYGRRLTYENVLEVLGAVDTEVFSRLLRMLISCDVSGCISLMDEVSAQGRELGQFITDFTWYLRNLMLVQTADRNAAALDMTKESFEALREEAMMVSLQDVMRYIRICSELSGKLRRAVSKRVLVEMALIKMMQPAMDEDVESLCARIVRLEDALAQGTLTARIEPAPPAGQGSEREPMQAEQTAPGEVISLTPAEYEDYSQLDRDWPALIRSFGAFYASVLRDTRVSWDKESGLCILFEHDFSRGLLEKGDRFSQLNEMINAHYGKEFRLTSKCLGSGEQEPSIVRGSRIEGINMDIGMEEGSLE